MQKKRKKQAKNNNGDETNVSNRTSVQLNVHLNVQFLCSNRYSDLFLIKFFFFFVKQMFLLPAAEWTEVSCNEFLFSGLTGGVSGHGNGLADDVLCDRMALKKSPIRFTLTHCDRHVVRCHVRDQDLVCDFRLSAPQFGWR